MSNGSSKSVSVLGGPEVRNPASSSGEPGCEPSRRSTNSSDRKSRRCSISPAVEGAATEPVVPRFQIRTEGGPDVVPAETALLLEQENRDLRPAHRSGEGGKQPPSR